MASALHLFRAPKRQLSMEEIETTDAIADYGFAGCARQKEQQAPAAVSGQRNAGRGGSSTGHYPRKHHHRRHQREWPGIGRAIAHWSCTSASEWRLYAMRSIGKGTAGLAPRNIWQARDVVPSLARWNNSRRRRDRARGSGLLVSSLENFPKLLRRGGP